MLEFLNVMLVHDLRSETCDQIALAIKDEVEDLERAGITVIQIDEGCSKGGFAA